MKARLYSVMVVLEKFQELECVLSLLEMAYEDNDHVKITKVRNRLVRFHGLRKNWEIEDAISTLDYVLQVHPAT